MSVLFVFMVCVLNNVPVDITDLYRGFKPSKAQEDLLRSVAERSNWITLTSDKGRAFRLGEIPRIVREYSPDLLLIDGLLLVGAESRGQPWEQIKDLSYGLKNLAIAKQVPLIVSHQATRSAHNTARPPGMHEVAYGDAFGQACDRVLALSRPHVEQGEEELLRVTVQKFRKGRPHYAGIDLAFSPERGKIHEFVPTDITGHGNILDNPEPQGIGDALSIP